MISFINAGNPAMLRSEQNDTNTNIAATLVCNVWDAKNIIQTHDKQITIKYCKYQAYINADMKYRHNEVSIKMV